MTPIYRFDFDSDTGTVNDAVVITDYEEHLSKYTPRDFSYRDPKIKMLKYIARSDFGRFKSGRVYLWEDDKATAIKLVKEDLEARVSKAYSAYTKALNAFNMLKEEC